MSDFINEQPLKGKRVVVTRAQSQAAKLSKKLKDAGAGVLELPLIDIRPTYDQLVLGEVFVDIATYEWCIFTSANGVKFFFEAFFKAFDDIRAIGPMRFACIGASTARAVKEHKFAVDLVPNKATSESLAQALIETDSLDSANVLVVTGSRNKDTLPKVLEEEGRAIVDTMQVYETVLTDLSKNPDAKSFREKGADWVTFTSASTVQNFIEQADALKLDDSAQKPFFASIGPITTQTLQDKSLPVHAEAEEAKLGALIDAIAQKS